MSTARKETTRQSRRDFLRTGAAISSAAFVGLPALGKANQDGIEDVSKHGTEVKLDVIPDSQRNDGSINPILQEIRKDILDRQPGEIQLKGVSSGFYELDKVTAGFQKSDFIILAGRPGMGKTSFCLNVALSASCNRWKFSKPLPVAIFSLKLDKFHLTQRLLCSLAGIDPDKMRVKRLFEHDVQGLNLAFKRLSDAPIFVEDYHTISTSELSLKARRLCETEKIGLIIIDYLQMMSHDSERFGSRHQEVTEISRSLKALAKELNIPVLAISQLPRTIDSRKDKIPQLFDLREFGTLEQDADVIMFIYRPEIYGIKKISGVSTEGLARLFIRLNRNGPNGVVDLRFVNEYARFENA